VSIPRVSQPPAQAQASQQKGLAMAVIMTGVLMAAMARQPQDRFDADSPGELAEMISQHEGVDRSGCPV
jgi:hypothetical protein